MIPTLLAFSVTIFVNIATHTDLKDVFTFDMLNVISTKNLPLGFQDPQSVFFEVEGQELQAIQLALPVTG